MVSEVIVSVENIDAALVHGPGLRWSVVGAHMAHDLGGGGIGHCLSHLGPSQERHRQDLGNPTLDRATQEKLIAGVGAEARGRGIDELEAARDRP